MFGRFRGVLRDLRPGEIGFCIASIGTLSFGVLLSNKMQDKKRKEEKDAQADWRRLVRHVEALAVSTNPVCELASIKYYMRGIRHEASRVFEEDEDVELKSNPACFSHDEVADEWIRRRNGGDKDALKIERSRLKLKRFWHTVESCVAHQQKSEKMRERSDDEPSILDNLLGGGRGKKDPNDRLIAKTIFFLETLDKACCRNHPKCIWSRDAPSFYAMLRRNVNRSSWPGPYSNDDDFHPEAPPIGSPAYEGLYDNIPESAIAQRMASRKTSTGRGQ